MNPNDNSGAGYESRLSKIRTRELVVLRRDILQQIIDAARRPWAPGTERRQDNDIFEAVAKLAEIHNERNARREVRREAAIERQRREDEERRLSNRIRRWYITAAGNIHNAIFWSYR